MKKLQNRLLSDQKKRNKPNLKSPFESKLRNENKLYYSDSKKTNHDRKDDFSCYSENKHFLSQNCIFCCIYIKINKKTNQLTKFSSKNFILKSNISKFNYFFVINKNYLYFAMN